MVDDRRGRERVRLSAGQLGSETDSVLDSAAGWTFTTGSGQEDYSLVIYALYDVS